jgi:hypothetical protein
MKIKTAIMLANKLIIFELQQVQNASRYLFQWDFLKERACAF